MTETNQGTPVQQTTRESFIIRSPQELSTETMHNLQSHLIRTALRMTAQTDLQLIDTGELEDTLTGRRQVFSESLTLVSSALNRDRASVLEIYADEYGNHARIIYESVRSDNTHLTSEQVILPDVGSILSQAQSQSLRSGMLHMDRLDEHTHALLGAAAPGREVPQSLTVYPVPGTRPGRFLVLESYTQQVMLDPDDQEDAVNASILITEPLALMMNILDQHKDHMAARTDAARLRQQVAQMHRMLEEHRIGWHDVKNLLSSTTLLNYFLERTGNSPEALRSGLAEMQWVMQSMQIITEDIRSTDTLGEPELKLTDFDLKAMLTSTGNIFGTMRRTERSGHQIDSRIELPDGFTVHADKRRVMTAVFNLLNNAIGHTKDGGRISLSARTIDGLNNQILIAVTNEGNHFDEVIWQKLMAGERVSTRRSSGRGIHSVQQVVSMHGGSMFMMNHENPNRVSVGFRIPVKT
ncbi:MAG: Signal-transduction histidine kinase senX3 [candidate division WS6 bacterium OLB20]|uniref:histidine kinase n=1 Tax=candidate division WS6 bacterium OLB20 TaxID=1617426 RepID=A0A136LYK0_9BACT|nr:MAG: Signal-transduction histidine kinase senX3 [candidate division WS6 bacterium OLB20]